MNTYICEKCSEEVRIGDSPYCRDNHEPVSQYHPFKPYFDPHISVKGDMITSWAQKRRLMKANHMDFAGRKVGEPGCEV